ncbi:MAG: DUF1566 domain-containing protein [Treponema sp.]|nr:DUF1566 domain-containing protein [Treponema sp.]
MNTVIACGPPRLRGTVVIEGVPNIGSTLTANISLLGGSGIITYQWLRDGSTAVADTNSYTLQLADRDSIITVTVMRSDNSGSVTSTPVTNLGHLGSTGPGGGIIFYDKGSVSDGWQYLEAASENQGSLAWASSSGHTSTNITGTGTAIGTGRANTTAILAIDANAPAALACKNYNGGGKSDWFLPGKDELYEMYKARNLLDISSGWFWSSSQYNNGSAWGQHFDDGSHCSDGGKNSASDVRAVRAF